MRTFTKALAAIALTVASVSSFAATVSWTGSLSGFKVLYFPSLDNTVGGAVKIIAPNTTTFTTVSGANCLGSGVTFSAGSIGDTQVLIDTLNAAKGVSGATVTISYENNSAACPVSTWQRN